MKQIIYFKNFNVFWIFYFVFTSPFILYWMSKTLIDIGLEKNMWMVSVAGVCFTIGMIFEMFGIKEKKEKQ